MTAAQPLRTPRRYDSTLRRERAAQTRERIITAGADLLQGSSIRDWDGVTIRAVAERAAVNERTVYRHFANERSLRDAVIHRLEREAGIDLDQLQLGDFADVAARIFRLVSAHPEPPRAALDPTLADASRRQHDALLNAVAARTPGWAAHDRTTAAAALDLLWSVGAYERLVAEWGFDQDRAVATIAWVIKVVEAAIDEGRPPGAPAQRP